MTWAKVDDQWWMHPKVLPLPMAARGLWTTALSYCGQRQSPHVPSAWVDMVAGDEGHNLAAALVTVGLWVEQDDGWEIHDWSEYQVGAKSEAKQNAGRIGGLTRALQAATERAEAAEAALGAESSESKQPASTLQAESKQASKQPPKHGPEPVPEPKVKNVAASADADAPDEIDQQFEDHFWPAYPKTNGRKPEKAKALQRWRKLSVQDRRDALRGAINRAKHVEVTGEQPPYAQRYLRDRKWEDDQAPVKVDPEVAGPRRLPDVGDEVEQDDRPAWKDDSGQWHVGGAA